MTDNGSPPDSPNTAGDRLAGERSETPIRIAAMALGAAALVAGAVAVFGTNNGAGTAALLGVGLALLVIAAFGYGIVKLRGGGVEVELAQVAVRSAAAHLEVAATRAELHGDDEAAAAFRAQAEAVLELGAARGACRQRLRAVAADNGIRVRTNSTTAGDCGSGTHGRPRAHHDPAEVRELFNSGKSGNRIYAIGLMQEDARLRDFAAMIEAIRGSRSAFEQYTALRLAEKMVPDLTSDERRELRATLEAERRRYITPDTDRWPISERILSKLG